MGRQQVGEAPPGGKEGEVRELLGSLARQAAPQHPVTQSIKGGYSSIGIRTRLIIIILNWMITSMNNIRISTLYLTFTISMMEYA